MYNARVVRILYMLAIFPEFVHGRLLTLLPLAPDCGGRSSCDRPCSPVLVGRARGHHAPGTRQAPQGCRKTTCESARLFSHKAGAPFSVQGIRVYKHWEHVANCRVKTNFLDVRNLIYV